MPDIFPLIRVSDVHSSIGGLNNGGITELLACTVFQHSNVALAGAVGGNGDVQFSPAVPPLFPGRRGIVNDQLQTALKRNGIGTRIWIDERSSR